MVFETEDFYIASVQIINLNEMLKNNISPSVLSFSKSENLNLSASHIYSIIRGNCNKSFVVYLSERKIEKACELLEQGMKVKEIAETLGYSSSKYFIYVFKRNKGVPPNQYKCIMQHR